MRKGLKNVILLLAVILAIGCTKENMEDCFSGVRLCFRFTLHEEPEKGDLFGKNVGHVRVYVFDEAGILQRVEAEKGQALANSYVMSLDLQPGRYSIVAWASDNEDFFRTYNQCQIINQPNASPAYKELEVGKSRLEDLRILLESEAADGYPENIKPTVNNFDDLFFGAVGTRSNDGKSLYTILPVEVRYAEIIEYEVELIRNTNIVRITIEGLEYLAGNTKVAPAPEELFDIWATGTNTQYQYDNIICTHAPSVRNFPQYSSPAANTIQADVKVERLEWTKQSGERLKLHVNLKNGKIFYSGELLSLLTEAKDINGNYIYKNQEDLDRIYIHPIRFVIGNDSTTQDIYVKIFIHNWELMTLIPEL